MKIERINDNQIRCTLSSLDLSSRNLNLGELAYGSEKARNLFREMIQKASNEVGFDAEDIPLMVEAIPLSNESVMLVITKIEDPEELDSRFAKFSPMSDDDSVSAASFSSEFLEGADSILDLLNTDSEEALDTSPETESATEKDSISMRVFTFGNLDEIAIAARAIGQVYSGTNTLYKKPDSSAYYLIIKGDEISALAFSRICNLLAEYGTKIKYEYASEAYYQEHYETIIKNQAIQALSKI